MGMTLIAAIVTLASAPQGRPKLPTAAEQKAIERSVPREAIEGAASKDPEKRRALAKRLAEAAEDSSAEAGLRYVLLIKTIQCASSVCDLAIAFDAAMKIETIFDVPAGSVVADALEQVGKATKTADEAKSAARTALGLIHRCKQAATASVMADFAERISRRCGDTFVVEAAKAASLMARRKGAAEKAEFQLSKEENASARLVLGSYLCFDAYEWAKGLPHLAKCSDPELKALAEDDLKTTGEILQMLELGERWLLASKKRDSAERGPMEGRAQFWFRISAKGATGLLKLKVERKLDESFSTADGLDLLKILEPGGINGTWTIREGALFSPTDHHTRIMVPYAPPDEYDLTVLAARVEGEQTLSLKLMAGERPFSVAMDAWQTADIGGIDRIDNAPSNRNETTFKKKLFPDTVPRTIVVSVRKTGISMTVDSKKVIDWKGERSRLSYDDGYVPHKDALAIGSYGSVWRITKVFLKPVSGAGRWLLE